MTDAFENEALYIPHEEGSDKFTVWAVDPHLQLITNVTEDNACINAEEFPDHVYFFAEFEAEKDETSSNLAQHARRELELIGEEPETIDGYLKVILAFSEMGHSGGSASVAIPVINQLLQFNNLSDLTDDPNEWMLIAEDVMGVSDCWQSRRRSEAFSNDGGKTYYLLSEGGNDKNRGPLHQSKTLTKQES